MAKRPTVPKFGNWENEGNAPYTTYFNEARKGKAAGGKMINPNDPEENPEMFADKSQPPAPAPAPVHKPMVPSTHDHRASREEEVQVPPHNDNSNPNRRTPGQRGGQTQGGRPVRPSVGSDNSFDRSPLHPHYQAKVTGKGGGSPAWEGKNSYDSSHGTPGRSRMKPNRGDESPDNGAAVPRFGDWDDNNPSSGENYTHIFNKVREERVTGSPMVSGTEARPNYNIQRNRKPTNKCCCFPWSK